MTDVVVIGGGASGLLAAGLLANFGLEVVLLEKNKELGKKLSITGKGRCNLTNKCGAGEVVKNLIVNGNFLYGALARFGPDDAFSFFENLGVKLKVERGRRVFPASDRASELVEALVDFCKKYGVKILNKAAFDVIYNEEKVLGVELGDGKIFCENVVVATGGLSYPQTGSTGDGYVWAKKAGHTISKISPSLVPIVTRQKWPTRAQGLSLKNVRLTVFEGDIPIFSDQGELLFTHFGVSGPLVLSASSHMRKIEAKKYKLLLDLKPALDFDKLNRRIVREISDFPNCDVINILKKLLPSKLVGIIFDMMGLKPGSKANQFSKKHRKKLVTLLKKLEIDVKSFRPIEYAIITSGGVDVSQINPKTMESKLKKGLYFIGEVLDVDGYTGGFNLQVAWSTAAAAAFAISMKRGFLT